MHHHPFELLSNLTSVVRRTRMIRQAQMIPTRSGSGSGCGRKEVLFETAGSLGEVILFNFIIGAFGGAA